MKGTSFSIEYLFLFLQSIHSSSCISCIPESNSKLSKTSHSHSNSNLKSPTLKTPPSRSYHVSFDEAKLDSETLPPPP